jgi:hypothetical protein
MDVKIPVFLNSALVGGRWVVSFTLQQLQLLTAPGTLWIGGWVGPIAALDEYS